MENYLRTYGWAANLVVITIACFLVAWAINGWAASFLAPYTVPGLPELAEVKKVEVKVPTRAKVPTDRVTPMASRCLFGCPEEDAGDEDGKGEGASACQTTAECSEGNECRDGTCQPVQDNVASADGLPVQSDLAVKLLGSMVANKSQWSTALLQDSSTQQTFVVRPYELLLGAEVLEVKRDRIIIRRNGRKEFIRMEDAIQGNPSAKNLATRAPIAPAPPKPEPDEPKQITQSNFVLDREQLKEKLANKQDLLQGATVVPNYASGKKSGLRLIGVKPDSAYS
ncbi:MAG: type II secretion system protein N, partial [Myxococcota bacterium]